MRALCWHGKGDVRVDTVPDPKIQHPRDAVIKITDALSAAPTFIC
jgi:threonine dehydrogenase-like Zn-dependent dehydrogenase